jgi:hypothetical protein
MDSNSINLLAALGSVLSVIVAIMALSLTHSQNQVKKYEIKRDYQEDIISWFSKTTELLIKLRFLLTNNKEEFESIKVILLAELSTQIEIGRLYFPNINKGDGYGAEKPKAYQGYRSIILVFLVYSFDIFLLDNAFNYEKHLLRLQREYTSTICEIIDPESFLNETKKHSDKFFNPRMSIIEFLEKNPENVDLFVTRRRE